MVCTGCGSEEHSHCRQSPPSLCVECGGVEDWAKGTYCSCWTDVSDLALADLKALFADGCEGDGLSVEADR